MYKFFLISSCILFVNGCATSGTALLGPVLTGAKSGSIYQTSLSYSSGRIIEDIRSKDSNFKLSSKKDFKKKNPTLPDIPYVDNDPEILLTYKVNYVEITMVIEPEPLP